MAKKTSKGLRYSKAKARKSTGRRAIGRPAASAPRVGRLALIEKTCELLRTLAPDKVTRAEVARYAKVDPSLIRYYFKERTALLVAAAEQIAAEYAQRIEKAIAYSNGGAADLLRLRIDALLDLKLAHPFFHRLIVDEIAPAKTQAAKHLVQQLTARAMTGYRGILETGRRDGSLREAEAAFLFWAVISLCEFFLAGVPILKIALGEETDPETLTQRYKEFVLDLLINGLKAPSIRA